MENGPHRAGRVFAETQGKCVEPGKDYMEQQNDRASWITGGRVRCRVPPPSVPGVPFRFVLLGAPGVGKGTQAERIAAYYGSCHLSTGDVFRSAKQLSEDGRASPNLLKALDYMRRGELVPDGIVLELVRERAGCMVCGGGFILDGFPRTVAQAEALSALLEEKGVSLTAVLNYELPIERLVTRLSGRRVCSGCRAAFHITTHPPRVDGVCDHCGEALYQREDDSPESIRVRMEQYEANTGPLKAYYSRRNLLVTIEAEGTPEEIFQRTRVKLDSLLTLR